jgi:hypothetical protein
LQFIASCGKPPVAVSTTGTGSAAKAVAMPQLFAFSRNLQTFSCLRAEA